MEGLRKAMKNFGRVRRYTGCNLKRVQRTQHWTSLFGCMIDVTPPVFTVSSRHCNVVAMCVRGDCAWQVSKLRKRVTSSARGSATASKQLKLTPWCWTLPVKPPQLRNNFPALCSLEPSTGSYPKPDQSHSNHYILIVSLSDPFLSTTSYLSKIHFNIIILSSFSVLQHLPPKSSVHTQSPFI
jgi:hypothetical protein